MLLFRAACFISATIFLLSCASEKQNAQAPQNFLLITLDTTRADRLGCYGYTQAQTPNLDELARRGARFENTIAHVPLTRPGHATILTGLLPHRLGIWSNGPYRLEPHLTTLPEIFKNSGFNTGAVVASFVLNSSFGFSQGFDLFDDRMKEQEGSDPEKTADDVATAAIQMLNTSLKPPFILWVHFYDPHFPYIAPNSPPHANNQIAYDHEITFMDSQIGKIIDFIDAKKWLNETLVIAVADHGEGLGEHGEDTHGYYIYDSTMKVPLIVAGPNVPRGKKIQAQVRLCDIAPTVLEAFGIAAEKLDGASFWKGMQAGDLRSELALIENRTIQNQFGWAALAGIRTPEWKWINAPQPELYDLKRDPKESLNIASIQTKEADGLERARQKILPQELEATTQRLTPEEEEKLASLGYLSGRSAGSADMNLPDPKEFAGILADVENLIRLRQQKKIGELSPVISKILKRDPQNLFAMRVQSEVLIAKKKYAEALPVLRFLAEKEETHPETFAHLAEASRRTGMYEDASRWYEKAVSPPWIHWPALEPMANFAIAHPDILSPQAVEERLKLLQPRSYRECISAARAFAILSDWNKAHELYTKSLEFEPNGAEALVGLSQVLQKTGQRQQALLLLEKVKPETAESLFVSGTILYESEPKQEACDRFRKSFSLQPSNANLLFGLGYHLSVCGEESEAIKAYTASLNREPDLPESLYNLAQMEEKRGNKNKAQALYSKFVKLAPARFEAQRKIALEKLKH